jgi:hypothetical protein
MACHKKLTTGHCSHPQCGFSDQTEHGYECVDIFYSAKQDRHYCEVGHNCVKECPYSYGDDQVKNVDEATTEEWFPELKQEA